MLNDRGGRGQARVSTRGGGLGGLAAVLGFAVVWSAAWLLLVSAGPASATATGPCGAHGALTYSNPRYTCTYTAAGADLFVVPAGVTAIAVHAVGAPGGVGSGDSVASIPGAPGGLGADVSATLPVTGGKSLQLNVGAAGSNAADAGAAGGGGGGASDVRDGSYRLSDRLVVAGGGGGGGGWGGGCESIGGPTMCGGESGAAGGATGSSGATGASGAGSGGQPGTSTAGGAGGAGGPNLAPGNGGTAGTAGSAGSLGNGGAGGGNGGAGGEGYFGGGGGGGGSSINNAQQQGGGTGGGGGGGSSYVKLGAGAPHIQVASAGETPEVAISWTQPGPPAPAVSALDPGRGPASGGVLVRIVGSHLWNATAVHFGAVRAKIDRYVSANELKVSTPRGSGTVDVTVTSAAGTSKRTRADRYTYLPRPTVTKLSPARGRAGGGTVVTVTGSNLAGATAVHFGTAPAKIDRIVSASELRVTAPKGSGTIDVTVTTPGGTSAKRTADRYTY